MRRLAHRPPRSVSPGFVSTSEARALGPHQITRVFLVGPTLSGLSAECRPLENGQQQPLTAMWTSRIVLPQLWMSAGFSRTKVSVRRVMSLSIFGQVIDIQSSNAVEGATVVIVEPRTTDVLYSTTTTFATAGPGGYFTFNFTVEQVFALMDGAHHRTITLKVYDETVFLGCLDVLVSAVSFMGTQTYEVKVDSSYNPPNNGFLYSIAGQVLEVDGSPIPDLDVKVYEQKMASEDPLETEQTASDGRFLVRYEGPAHSHPDQALIGTCQRL